MTDTPIRTAQDALEAAVVEARAWFPGSSADVARYPKFGIVRSIEALSDRIQPVTLPDREAIARAICAAMWGDDLADHYRQNDDVRWDDALQAADAILALMKGEG